MKRRITVVLALAFAVVALVAMRPGPMSAAPRYVVTGGYDADEGPLFYLAPYGNPDYSPPFLAEPIPGTGRMPRAGMTYTLRDGVLYGPCGYARLRFCLTPV